MNTQSQGTSFVRSLVTENALPIRLGVILMLCGVGTASIAHAAETNSAVRWSVQREHPIEVRGSGGKSVARRVVGNAFLAEEASSPQVLVEAVFDPASRYYLAYLELSRPGLPASARFENHTEGIVIVPDAGLVHISPVLRGVTVEMSAEMADSAEQVIERAVAAGVTWDPVGGPKLAERRHETVSLVKALGREFFMRAGDARVPPLARVVRVNSSGGKVTAVIKSGISESRAILEFDLNCRLLRAEVMDPASQE